MRLAFFAKGRIFTIKAAAYDDSSIAAAAVPCWRGRPLYRVGWCSGTSDVEWIYGERTCLGTTPDIGGVPSAVFRWRGCQRYRVDNAVATAAYETLANCSQVKRSHLTRIVRLITHHPPILRYNYLSNAQTRSQKIPPPLPRLCQEQRRLTLHG